MLSARQELIRIELETGTGAAIGMAVDPGGLRTGLRIWFADLDERHGPIAELRPYGLKGYRLTLGFGTYAGEVVRQIQSASEEDIGLARALVGSIDPGVDLDLDGQDVATWRILSGTSRIIATARNLPADADTAVTKVCKDVIVPLMAAMAELIGYDVIEDDETTGAEYEGAILMSTIRRRERNPRNRLLCIRLHGEKCACCGLEPRETYGDAGGIIEVHHLEALSTLSAPRRYDPAKDLAPLCPNCHRAVHTRRPHPFTLKELRKMMGLDGGEEATG
ncbi:HNH endonuclease [Rhodovulum viride]|uniref:HNH endonuclease n=1 Tax=Rhodovulum viride TaxID=1231134 RepID=A0ABX9DFE5_9RHOB|nr:HNH endonuclease [Rhodovulum viride]RAP40414.1 HNH endonuclease [Rhodovulum viride]